MSETPRPASAGFGGGEPGPAQLLDDMRVLRDRTSAAAHAYWLPLLLFGLVVLGSLSFYQRLGPGHLTAAQPSLPGSCVTGQPCHVTAGVNYRVHVSALGWYWQLAVPLAAVLTALWYRWRADRTGLRVPARGFLITGLVLGELVLLVSLLGTTLQSGRPDRVLNDPRHVGPVLVLAAVLWVLAWSERSRALAIVVGAYLVVGVPVAVATGGGIGGGSTDAADISLATMRWLGLIPALVLLAGGTAAWLVQRTRLRA
jgi:hypothetical protein